MNGYSKKRDWNKKKRPMERRDKTYPKIYGKDARIIDPSKMKKVNIEAVERSKYNNMVIKELSFYNKFGSLCTINGGLLSIFTLTPSKALIDCNHIRLRVTKGPEGETAQECITRICTLDPNQLEICRLNTEKINEGRCFGRKSFVTSHEFWVATNGNMSYDGKSANFKIGFFNCNLPNGFTNQEFTINPDKQKAESLRNLYEKMKSGMISSPTVPKPGNIIFHTLFSGEVDIEIITITGDSIKGKVKGYNLTPGGTPSLNVWISETLKVIPLYVVESMIVNDYKIPDLMRKRTLSLLMNGHIVIPHAGNKTIYDYCKASFKGKEQAISLDGNITPRDILDTHDMEVDKIIKEIAE